MAGLVEAAPATFVLHKDRRSSLVEGLTSSLNKAATPSASRPLLDTSRSSGHGDLTQSPLDTSRSSGNDHLNQSPFDISYNHKSPSRTSVVSSFSAFPPSDVGLPATQSVATAPEATRHSTDALGRSQIILASRVSHSASSLSADRATNTTRPRLLSLSQATPLLAYQQEQFPSTSPTTAMTRTSLKRHSISGSAALSSLQAASAASSYAPRSASPPSSTISSKSIGRSVTINSPSRPQITSATSSPPSSRFRSQSFRVQSAHLKRRESASQYITLEDAAAEAARHDVRSETVGGTPIRRSSLFGQTQIGATSAIEIVQDSHSRERPVPRSAAGREELEAKLVILGSQGVGKTSLAYRYASGKFNPSAVPSTIGAAFLTKKLVVDNVNCRLQLWDTSGQEKWRAIAPMYYRGSNAALLVYDITSRRSFDDLKYWIEELDKNMGSDLVIHVVGSKLDLASHAREVDPTEAREQILQWLRPDRAAALAASQTVSVPAQPDVGMSSSTSRLSSLGSLAMGSASRLATAFPSTGRSGGASGKALGSSNGTSSGHSSEDAGESTSGVLPGDDAHVELSEVSSKDDRGIEEVFLAITQKLVLHREEIEQQRLARERNSIFLHASQAGEVAVGTERSGSWSCC